MLKMANEYYEEGLLVQNFATLTGDERTAAILNNQVGAFVTVTANAQNSVNDKLSESVGDEDAILFPLLPLKDLITGERQGRIAQTQYGGANMNYTYAISSSSEKIELVMKWVDYIAYSEEGMILNAFGVEGETYEVADDGLPKIMESITSSTNGKNYEMRTRGFYHFNMPYTWPSLHVERGLESMNSELRERADEVTEISAADPAFPKVIATSEEAEVISDAKGDMESYMDEMVLKFILGDVDVEEGWDEYVATLKSLGIDEVTAVKQAQYDRAQN
jgi:putative aldouronate transport system substrate-binding protein